MVNDGGVCLCVVLCYVLIKQLPFSSKVIYFVHQRSAEQIMHAMNQERERKSNGKRKYGQLWTRTEWML